MIIIIRLLKALLITVLIIFCIQVLRILTNYAGDYTKEERIRDKLYGLGYDFDERTMTYRNDQTKDSITVQEIRNSKYNLRKIMKRRK